MFGITGGHPRWTTIHVPEAILKLPVEEQLAALPELMRAYLAMGSAFNLARGVQFFTPVIIAVIARGYGLAGGISLAALFALLTGAWIWVFPETKGRRLSSSKNEVSAAGRSLTAAVTILRVD